MNNCINFRIRSKNYTKYYYCIIFKKEITKKDCINCKYKEYKTIKPIKKRTNKLNKKESQRYSYIYKEREKCNICNVKTKTYIHEVYFGKNRQNSIKYGMCMHLCSACHKKIHNDHSLNLKYRRIFQMEFEKIHSRQEFIDIFKQNYLK